MAFNDGLYWYKNVLKKQLKLASRIYLSIAIVLAPIFLMSSANAANVGGWNLSNAVAQGASTVYDATKNVVINGKNFIKESSVKITPTASQVAKTIARTAGVTIAIEMLIGAVSWVLDPANNRVIYYEDPPPKELLPKLWVWDSAIQGKDGVSTAEEACKKAALSKAQAIQYGSYMYTVYKSVSYTGEDSARCIYDAYNTSSGEKYPDTTYHDISRKVNTAYNPDAADEREEKYLPYDTVAQQLISNAESGQPEAQAHTMAAAATAVAEAEKDEAKARPIVSQAEANATTKPADAAEAENANEAQGESKPNTQNPEVTDISLEFPVFCNWAPTICEAAQTVISFPQTLTNWWETGKSKAEQWATSISESWAAAKEWATSEPQSKEPENLPIEDLNINAAQVNLSASSTCPHDSVSFSVMGKSVTLDMPYQPVCDALNFFKPAVLLVGAVASVYIVAGVRTKEEDQS